MFFHVPATAHKATGLHLTTIKTILERGGNPIYHRKFDNKLFEIRREDPIKIFTIEGEDFFSLEEIQAKFDLSPTKFLNQVKNGKFAKKIDWFSPELFPENDDESEDEKENELEKLRAEMKSQFEKFRAEMKSQFAEIERLSSRVENLEKEKAQLQELIQSSPPQTAEVSPNLPEGNPVKSYPVRAEPIFKTTKSVFLNTFNPKAFANFIRWGIIGRLSACTPLRAKYVLWNDARTFLPDLVEEIIATHIIPDQIGTLGSEKAKDLFERNMTQLNSLKGADAKKLTPAIGMVGRVRRLDQETIHNIAKELMKLI